MKRLHRIAVFSGPALVALCACNAILGIGDLKPTQANDSGEQPDANNGSATDANDHLADANVPSDGAADAGPPLCANQASADPCLVIVDQSAGSIYPTWRITSFVNKHSIGVSVVPPVLPVYQDAGDGTVVETHSQLVWQTRLAADAGEVDRAGAQAACAAYGPGWRLPSRIELSSLHARDEIHGPPYTPSCLPAIFQVIPPFPTTRAWTSTEERDLGKWYQGYENTSCGLDPQTANALVRCVKGDLKPATFEIRRSNALVWARETNLDWERTGIIVKSFAEAKAHCDQRNARVPVLEEVTSIIDTRLASVFDPSLFVAPQGGMRGIISSTPFGKTGDQVTMYEVLAMQPESVASVDVVPTAGDDTADLLVRCVSEHL